MDESRILKLISQMIRDTSEGKVTWSSENPPATITRATEDYISRYFAAQYKGQRICVYKRRYKHYQDMDDYVYSERVEIALLDNKDNLITNLESDGYVVMRLFDTINEKVFKLDSILELMIEEESF